MNTKKLALLFTILAIVALSLAPVAQAQQPQQPAAQAGNVGVVTERVRFADQKAALSFWTREELANAQPLEMVDYSGDASAVFTEDSSAVGDPGMSMAGAAAPNANAVAKKFFAADWAAASQGDSAFADEPAGTSQIFDSYIVNQWAAAQKIYPHKWIGRFSFNSGSGTSYCSATAISNNNIVTAAHCVYNTTTNVFYTSKVFTPAYRAGNAPYGTFATTGCSVLTAWANLSGAFSINGWTKYDLAVCSVGTNAASQTLNTAVGWAGRSWNNSYVVHYFDLGYPWRNTDNVAITNAGLYLRTCASESFKQTTDTLGTGCNWGPGISGGPWFKGYQQNVVAGYVASVNSGLFIGTDNLYGIRFTSNNIVILCGAPRNC